MPRYNTYTILILVFILFVAVAPSILTWFDLDLDGNVTLSKSNMNTKTTSNTAATTNKSPTTPTSLEILYQVLDEYDQENERDPSKMMNPTQECLRPNVNRTQQLVVARKILPRPIINVGFPKTGTTTMQNFFQCLGEKVSHYKDCHRKKLLCSGVRQDSFACPRESQVPEWNGTETQKCGKCMDLAVQAGLGPIASCSVNGALIFAQPDAPTGLCLFPQISLLDEIHKESPNATFLLPFRSLDSWISSIDNWKVFRRFRKTLTRCDIPGFARHQGKDDSDFYAWFCTHVQHVRRFVALHPSHALVEYDLNDNVNTPRLMGQLFASETSSTSSSCWGHRNKSPLLGSTTNHNPPTSQSQRFYRDFKYLAIRLRAHILKALLLLTSSVCFVWLCLVVSKKNEIGTIHCKQDTEIDAMHE